MTISYGIGKYVLAFGVLLSGWGAYGVITNDTGNSNVGATFAILFGIPITIGGLLFMLIARQRRLHDESLRRVKEKQKSTE